MLMASVDVLTKGCNVSGVTLVTIQSSVTDYSSDSG